MSSRSATGRRTSASTSGRIVPVQTALTRTTRATPDNKNHILRAMETPTKYGITTILDPGTIEIHTPMELYEMVYGGSADPFHGLVFQAERIQERMVTADLIRSIDVQSSIYKCPRPSCGDTRILVRQKQLSSGDESATTQYRCTKCGFEWFNTGRG